MISRKFIKSSLIYSLAGTLPIASSAILLPLYIAYLPPSVYGSLSIYLSFSILVQILVTYSFDTSIYIHFHELKNSPEKLASFISSSFIFILISGLVVGTILSISGQLIFSIALPNNKISFYPYGFVSVGIGIFQSVFKVYSNLLQIEEKPNTYLWSNVFLFTGIAAVTFFGLKLFPSTLIGPLGARVVTGFALTLWILFRIFRKYGIHFKSPWQQTSFSFNAYTFVYQVQQWVINYFDRFVLSFLMPMASVGLYDFSVKCLVPVDFALNGLNTTINPRVVKLISEQDVKGSSLEINRYFYGLMSVIMLVVCLGIVAIPLLGDLLIKESVYIDAMQFVPYLALIYIFKASRIYFVVPYNVLRKMKKLTILNFFVAVLKILLMIFMITRWQLYGLIFSSMIAFTMEEILLWHYIRNDYKIKFNPFKLFIAPLLLILIILLTERLFANYAFYIHSGYFFFCIGLLWIAYKNEFKLLYSLKLFK